MRDGYGRQIDYLRISVTDKCNLRCRYCMPPEGITRLSHEEVLSLEEIFRLVGIMEGMGIKKVRLTGGEPLVRKNLVRLVQDIRSLPGIEEIALTTNGILFGEQAGKLKDAGLTGVNISLDTLSPESFCRITGAKGLEQVLGAVEEALLQELTVKLNCVPVRELNEQEIVELAQLARDRRVDLRYIELMPIGCGRQFQGIPSEEVKARLEAVYGPASPIGPGRERGGPAEYYQFQGFQGRIGFISPLSHKFCSSCNRVRLTAEGRLKLCLHYERGLELKPLLRGGASDEQIRQAIEAALLEKPEEHSFGQKDGKENAAEEKDNRKMVQIGG